MNNTVAKRPHDTSDAYDGDVALRQVYLGMQLFRANSLSLTHLQFALRHGDRKSVLESVDQLHELDCRIGRLLEGMAVNDQDDPELQAMARQIEQQRVAVSFEKLALASGVHGPAMATAPDPRWAAPLAEGAPDAMTIAPTPDQAPRRRTFEIVLAAGMLVLVLVMAAAALVFAR